MRVLNGIDIIENKRIEDSFNIHGDKFLKRIYTEDEINYSKGKIEKLATRFCAKEAFLKAVSEMVENKYMVESKDIEILNKENGKPYINFQRFVQIMKEKNNLKIDYLNILDKISVDISLSNLKEFSIASCMILINDE